MLDVLMRISCYKNVGHFMSHITSLHLTVLNKNIHTLCIYILKIVTYLFICTYHNIILNKNTVGFNLKESIYYEL